MRTLVLVAAEGFEFRGLLRRLKPSARLDWPARFARSVEWRGARLVLVAEGPGPALASRAVELAERNGRIDFLISTGLCGGLDSALAFGHIVAASEVVALDPERRFTAAMPETGLPYATGVVVSQNRVAQTVEEKRRLAAFGVAVEMEAAAVAAHAERLGVSFACVKVVSDTAGEGFGIDLNAARGVSGRFRTSRILAQCARRPALIPSLLELRQRTRRASEILGAFLVDSRF